MSEKNDFALVPRPSSAIEKVAPGAKHILSGMVADTLALRKETSAFAAKTFRIGEYEWCEPDYHQIIVWAKATNFKPEDFITVLFSKQGDFARGGHFFGEQLVAAGRLWKVNWDYERLQCYNIEWVEGLAITHILFNNHLDD